jgi:cystathionine beta-lyase
MAFNFDTPFDRRNTGSLKWDFCERIQGEKDVIPMWVADMDFPAPPAVVDAVRKRAGHGAYGYPMIPRSFWESALRWIGLRQRWDVKREWMSLLPGVVPALSLCVGAFSQPGDKIIIQTPVYHPFFTAVENNGRRLVRNPLKFENGRFDMDFEDLRRKIDDRTRMMILCSPHNPVGRVWARDDLARLGEICADRDVILISDEIHVDLIMPGHCHVPLASISAAIAARTVTLTASSKTFNVAGLTTALAITPNPRLKSLLDAQIQSAGLTIGNIFGLVALEAAYTHGGSWLDELLAYLEGNGELARRFFPARVPGIVFLKPEGTYLGLLDCRALGLDQKTLNEFFLRKAKVYFDPGPRFGEELRGFQRINLGCPRSLLGEALDRIERAARAAGFSGQAS